MALKKTKVAATVVEVLDDGRTRFALADGTEVLTKGYLPMPAGTKGWMVTVSFGEGKSLSEFVEAGRS